MVIDRVGTSDADIIGQAREKYAMITDMREEEVRLKDALKDVAKRIEATERDIRTIIMASPQLDLLDQSQR